MKINPGACASDKEYGFKLLMENFQQPIYWHIRRLVVSHEDAEDILQEVLSVSFVTLTGLGKRARWHMDVSDCNQ